MLTTRTPLRISLVGGGTDTPSFFRQHIGAVVSFAISKCIYVSVNKKFDGKYRISYSKTENVDTIDKIQHDLVRESLKMFTIPTGLEITSVSDIPGSGTGLGSSSAFTVGLLNALGRETDKQKLAERAFTVEAIKCRHPIGKQDCYASAYGGMNLFRFSRKTVSVSPIELSDQWKNEFESHCLLLWTGITRDANEILERQDRSFRSGGNIKIGTQMTYLAEDLHSELLDECPMIRIGEFLTEGWIIKKFFANGISSANIDRWIEICNMNGAYGAKLLGAGGGGFILCIAHPDTHKNIIQKTGLKKFDFKIEKEGSKVIYES
jgi:D-glycero-alpha-D-manno-heptose-7-phosphate kinase